MLPFGWSFTWGIYHRTHEAEYGIGGFVYQPAAVSIHGAFGHWHVGVDIAAPWKEAEIA